ncbi:MAG: recombinase family protein [Alphaproteobacteria bacterium]|nr:recombinase family protein [Alphaproteobacteria bacterium]
MKRVAIYCRVSTDMEQSLRSLENQILAYIDMVQHHPDWELIGIYADRGISGTSIRHRASFQRLLRHSEAGKIELILTKSISRFSRNTHDLIGTLRQLRRLRVDVFFEKEGIRMSEAGNEMMMTM